MERGVSWNYWKMLALMKDTVIIPGCWNKVASRTSDAGDSLTSPNSTSPNSTNDEHQATLQESTTSTSLKRECVLLKGYVDTPISWATSRRWLQRLGYHYYLRKKTFFVDGHERPNVVSFELGVNNEGYWTYNHMSVQFEDCVDCLKVVYPHFDFVFLSRTCQEVNWWPRCLLYE
jgi:hypothetical protein